VTGVQTVVVLLLGDEVALDAQCGGWVELLVAELLHVYPSLRAPADLASLAQLCLKRKGSGAWCQKNTPAQKFHCCVLLEGTATHALRRACNSCPSEPSFPGPAAHAPPFTGGGAIPASRKALWVGRMICSE